MKHFATLLIIICFSFFAKGQNDSAQILPIQHIKPNNINLELLGVGNSYTLNYERFIFYKKRFKTSVSVGGTHYFGNHDAKGITHCFTASLSELYTIKNNHLEIGLSPTYWNRRGIPNTDVFGDRGGEELYIVGKVAFRYQKPNGRLMLRVAYNPFYIRRSAWNSYDYIYSWGGITLGYCF